LPKTLANIPGCRIPHVETADPKTPGELVAVCEKFDSWPLIVRARGYHGGERMLLLNSAAQIDSLEDLFWLYSGIFLIEFIDYINEDGLYQKTRVIMVDGQPYPRHSIFSDSWAVNSSDRVKLMDKDVSLCHREEHFLADLRDEGLKKCANVFQEIYQRIGLDVFGIDFTLVNEQIVIFEANACMSFLGDRHGGDQYQYLDSYLITLRRSIKQMLVNA
jgi:hypothetical protein